MSTLALPSHTTTIGRQRSVSDKFVRSASPTLAISTMNRQRSISGHRIDSANSSTLEHHTPTGSLLSPPQYTQHQHQQHHLLSSTISSMSDHKASSRTLSPYNHSSYSQSSDSLVHSLPTRKLSSSNFIKLARQASDTAFRSVGLNRKQSDHNLREQAAAASAHSGGGGGVYEQNPKVYLYQQHQQQQQLHQHIKIRQHHPLRPQVDDTVPEEWAMNNQLLHTTEPCISDEYYDHPPIVKPFASRSLRRNVSMPDMKGTAAAATASVGAGQSSCEPRTSRATSPQPPAHRANRSRSRSRPRVQPHHFITTAMANNNSISEPATVTSSSNSAIEPTTLPKSSPVSSGDERANNNIQRTPSRPPRNQNHTSPHQKVYQLHQNQIEQQRHHEQQRQRLLTRHQVMSDESLPEYGDAVLSMSMLEGSSSDNSITNNNLSSKDLPPTPPGPLPSFSFPTRSRRRTESNSETDSTTTSPTSSMAPVLPSIGTSLTRNGSRNGGIIPQDVLRSMDPKDVQRVVSSTVITSRVYKVLNTEQLESLKKEQEGLQQFVEAMNVSLHIETRMRDASYSLIRLHESNLNIDAVKAANNQLHATTFKMDQIVQKSQQAMWRLLATQRLLLQHETAVLNAGLRRLDNENRDLSRAVMNLETARGQEKEEKLKWKKEHTRLKVQSIMFVPTSPVVESNVAVPPTPQLQLVQEQLSAMESYAKELSEDVLQKDEKLNELRNELGAVRGWTNDFEASIHLAKKDSLSEAAAVAAVATAEKTLQEQLKNLQSMIETDYKDFHVHADELQFKVDQLTEENLTLATAAASTHCKNLEDDDSSSSSSSSSSPSQSSLGITEQQQQERHTRRSWRIRPGFSSSRESIELHNVLRESLWELDRQIERDERLSSICSSSSSSSLSSSVSSSCRNSSASTASSNFSIDNANFGKLGNESPLMVSRRSSSKSTTSSGCGGGGRLSRTSSTSSSSKFGLREQVLMRDLTTSPDTVALGLGQVIECEDEVVVGGEEKQDAILKEIKQIVMHGQEE